MEIRPAILADVPALADLAGQLGYPATAAEVDDRLAALLHAADHAVLVACAPHGSVVGWIHVFCALRLESGRFAEIGGLVVAAPRRHQGIGRQLVSAAEAWASARGVAKLRVRSRVERDEATRFYEALGFRKTKEQRIFDKTLAK